VVDISARAPVVGARVGGAHTGVSRRSGGWRLAVACGFGGARARADGGQTGVSWVARAWRFAVLRVFWVALTGVTSAIWPVGVPSVSVSRVSVSAEAIFRAGRAVIRLVDVFTARIEVL